MISLVVYRKVSGQNSKTGAYKGIGHHIFRSREVCKPRDMVVEWPGRSEIWPGSRQQCCLATCQISDRNGHINSQSRCYEASRDLLYRLANSLARPIWVGILKQRLQHSRARESAQDIVSHFTSEQMSKKFQSKYNKFYVCWKCHHKVTK